MNGSARDMSKIRIRVDPRVSQDLPEGRVGHDLLDETTEQDLALQQQQDDDEGMRDMAKAMRVLRERLGLTQQELARRIDVPEESIRDWEQGKQRPPRSVAKYLKQMFDRDPQTTFETGVYTLLAIVNESLG